MRLLVTAALSTVGAQVEKVAGPRISTAGASGNNGDDTVILWVEVKLVKASASPGFKLDPNPKATIKSKGDEKLHNGLSPRS